MKNTAIALAGALLLTCGFGSIASAQPVAWTLDKNHSHIGFTARHLAFAKVRGEFKQFDGTFTADAKTGKLSALEATAEAASVDTDNAKRDKHLRSDDFFAAEAHPQMKLKLKSIKWKGNRFTATVALTLRGNTNDVEFEGELLGVQSINFGSGAHPRAAYEATARISRKAFGLKFGGLAEGVSIVGDEVELHLEVELALPPKK